MPSAEKVESWQSAVEKKEGPWLYILKTSWVCLKRIVLMGLFYYQASSQSVNQAVQGRADLRRHFKIYKTNPFSYLQKWVPLHSTRLWRMKTLFYYILVSKLAQAIILIRNTDGRHSKKFEKRQVRTVVGY